jgi:hypothetical protein
MMLDRFFRIAPVKYKAKDGSGRTVVVEHRIGRAAGHFTKNDLMLKTGLEQEYSEDCSQMARRIKDRKSLRRWEKGEYTRQQGRMGRMVDSYRKFLAQFYEVQGLVPRMVFVPHDKDNIIFIQGLVNTGTHSLVAGEAEDTAAWTDATQRKNKPSHERYEESIAQAKALLRLPSINKDLEHRLRLLASGELPPLLEGPKDKKKGDKEPDKK